MKKLKNLIVKGLYNFLNNFPDNAKSWKNATHEIVTIADYLIILNNEIGRKKLNSKQKIELNAVSIKPDVYNKKWKNIIKFIIETNKGNDIFEKHLVEFYENFGLWFDKKIQNEIAKLNVVKLNENQQFNNKEPEIIRNLSFMLNPTNQFKFDCGVVFENLINPKEPDKPYSIKYYIDNAKSEEEFKQMITDRLKIVDGELTTDDFERLMIHVNKYNK